MKFTGCGREVIASFFVCYVTKKKRFKANAENLFHEITEEMNEKYKIVPTPHLYHYQ